MSDAVLRVLNYVVIGALYVFFAYVIRTVWREVSGPRKGTSKESQRAAAGATLAGASPGAAMPAVTLPDVVVATVQRPSRFRRKAVPEALVILDPKTRRGDRFEIGAEVILGRAPSCGIDLSLDPTASNLHARLARIDGEVVVDDLGSRNGTTLNGVRVTARQTLHVGDRLQAGSTVFEAR